MAKLTPGLGITGPLQNLSIYSREDCNELIVRTKGGATKHIIQTSPSFEHTRKLNIELGGKSTGSKWIRELLHPLKPIVDYQWSSKFVSFLTVVQQLDTTSELGKRNVQLSRKPQLFEGYLLNKRNPLEAVAFNPITCEICKQQLSATIQVPSLLPGYNFSPIGTFPYYRWTIVFGIIPDLFCDTKEYYPDNDFRKVHPVSVYSDWLPVQSPALSLTHRFQLSESPGTESFSLVLAAGISFGIVKYGSIVPVKGAGAGKILAVR